MGSRKSELLAEIEQLQAENTQLALEIRVHEDREREQQRRKHRAEQEKRKAAEQKERRDRISDLAAGKLALGRVTQWTIVSHVRERPGLVVFVPMDAEEMRVALGFLRRMEAEVPTVDFAAEELRRQLRERFGSLPPMVAHEPVTFW